MLALEGREAAAHHRNTKAHLHDALDVSDWITRALRNAIDEFTARLQTGLAILASVGSTAPFIGLFGTVWGIYHALMSIGSAGQATIDKVAGPIGEALIMTALGLAVAIPAVLGYNALVRGNKFVLTKMNSFAHDVDMYRAWARAVVDDKFDGPYERKYAVGCAFLRGIGRGRVVNVHGVEKANAAVGSIVVESKLPARGTPKSDSYEGDGYVIVRHTDTEVVKKAMTTIIENIQVEYA